jgi:NAD kinase
LHAENAVQNDDFSLACREWVIPRIFSTKLKVKQKQKQKAKIIGDQQSGRP